MIFSKLVVQSCRIKTIRPRLCCAQLRNSNSSSNFPNHGIDLDVYHTLASTNKVMADSFLLKQIEMKDVAIKGKEEAISSNKLLIDKLNEEIIRKDLGLGLGLGIDKGPSPS